MQRMIYAAHIRDAASLLGTLERDLAAMRAALERLGSTEAFTMPDVIDPNGELATRIRYARSALLHPEPDIEQKRRLT